MFWVQNSAQASVLQREVGRFYEASCLQLPPGAKKKKKAYVTSQNENEILCVQQNTQQ